MFNKKKKKIYNLIEIKLDTYGLATSVRTKIYPYDTFAQALDAIENHAKTFEQARQGEYEVCVRLCDDPDVKVLVSRDCEFQLLKCYMNETRLFIKEAYI